MVMHPYHVAYNVMSRPAGSRLLQQGLLRRTTRRLLSTILSRQPLEEIPVSEDPSALADALRPFFQRKTPVVLKGAASTFPAVTSWSQWDYWKETVPEPTMCAVEIGGSYSSESSQRAEIPFHAYVMYLQQFEDKYGAIASSTERNDTMIPPAELVYLAQNDLFPELQKDVVIPEFCQNNNKQANIGLGRLYSTMLWLGPRGCVSPLHFDPLDNLLCQLKGRKRVLVLSPSQNETNWHSAGQDGQQNNTSPIPMEQDDLSNYPLLENAPPVLEATLQQGDILYIPSKWWHYVRSIDSSASVNIWWR